ncbi:hypothetical protein HOLleu_34953 [Holothuria leucospilota]|uniref:C-type lectin domain-containing protein n=1 Tax=Holothuria leucospilota TaxID=206669 RepID=A0A9Q0YSP0_HOLLE|nr:hypothetical protein HOLleu_34953 [Holothuria leucospilota]
MHLPWEDAKKICEDSSAHLIFITSQEELKFVLRSINSFSWIGRIHRHKKRMLIWVANYFVARMMFMVSPYM